MAYLSVSDYVARFGERETVMLTNTSPAVAGVPSAYDSAKVEAAIGDAQEVAEGYIGKRYAVPVVTPPRIVLGWIAALAREALHVNTGKTVEAVGRAADLARSQLKEVANGLLTLPIEEGQTAPAVIGQGYARTSGDRAASIFSDTGALDALTAPFTGGFSSPCWRGGR